MYVGFEGDLVTREVKEEMLQLLYKQVGEMHNCLGGAHILTHNLDYPINGLS